MKFFVIVALFAVVHGEPATIVTPLAYSIPIISSQYHSQDTLGQYNYGYINALSSKNEIKSVDGITRGGYTYIDAEGKLQSVQYTSDAVNGFRVAASNLPIAPTIPKVETLHHPIQDTPEVAAAKIKHLTTFQEAKTKATKPEAAKIVTTTPILTPSIHTYAYGIGAPFINNYYHGLTAYAAPWISTPSLLINAASLVPGDTPEVAMAKAEHLATVEEIKARN